MKKKYYWIAAILILFAIGGVFVFLNFNQIYDAYIFLTSGYNRQEETNFITQCKVDSNCKCFGCMCLNKDSKTGTLHCPKFALCDFDGCICVNNKCQRNTTCNSCIENFKEDICIVCSEVNWTNKFDYNHILLFNNITSCITTYCNSVNISFPKNTTCDYAKGICGIYGIK